MPRFSDEVLEEIPLDPKRELRWCKCPWCPGVVLWGFRRDRPKAQGIGGTTLMHANLVEVEGVKPLMVADAVGGCARYTEIASKMPGEFIRMLASAGAQMKKNND